MKKYFSFRLSSPLLKIANFRKLLMTRVLVTMTLQVQAVIIGWHIYSLKKDALLLGMIGLTEAIPAIVGALIAGHVVDNSRPVQVFKGALAVIAMNSLLLFLGVMPSLQLSDNLVIALMFLGIFISGAARSFLSPSTFSLIPKIVSRDLLSSAAAFNSGTYQLASITGPAVGGLMYGLLGAQIAFLVPVAMSIIACLMPATLSQEIQQYRSDSVREPIFQSIKSGLNFALTHKVLLSAMTLDMFSVLFGGAVAVLPLFADQVFHVGAEGLGILRASPAIGSVCVSLVLAMNPLKKITGKQLLFVVTGFGIFTICFALTQNYVMALFFLFLTGAFDGVSMVIRGTILQLYTPDQMRGRVSAVNSVFITSSNEIGAFESGFAAKMMGLIPSVLFGGIMTIVVVCVVAWKFPELSKTEIKAKN